MRTSPPVRMNRSGSGAYASAMSDDSAARRALGGHARRDGLAAGLHDVPAAAIVEGHRQRDARVVRGAALGLVPGGAHLVVDRAAVADDADAHALLGQLGQVLRHRHQHQAHQAGDLFARALPVLGREREHREVFDAAVGAGLHAAHQRIDALLVAEEARHEALLGPAAVAVHHDGHVARHGVQVALHAQASRLFIAERFRPPGFRLPWRGPACRSRRSCGR